MLPASPEQSDVESQWESFLSAVRKTGEEVLGFKKRKHRDWFGESDEEVQALLRRKKYAYTAYLRCPTSVNLRDT